MRALTSLVTLSLLLPAVASASGGGRDDDLMPAPERDAVEAGMHAAESGVPPYDELMIIADAVYDYITDKLAEEFGATATAVHTTTASAEPATAEACLDLMDEVWEVCDESAATAFVERHADRAQASTCEDLSLKLDELVLALDEHSWDAGSLELTDALLCERGR
jgi:hypothetical protein